MNSFSLGTEEQPIWHYCNSSVAQCRSSKAKSEKAGITRRQYHQGQLPINTWFSIYRIIIVNTNSYSQYPTSKQVLGLRLFLTQPGRSLNAGYSWPGGFPPRSKWTYGDVFHPAVVPQPPFNNNQANSFSLAVNKKTKNKNKSRRILTISTNRILAHQSKQVRGIPNKSELIHLQYFSFELYQQFSKKT